MAMADLEALSLRERHVAPVAPGQAAAAATVKNETGPVVIPPAGSTEPTYQRFLAWHCDYAWRLVERLGKKRGLHADDIAEAQSDAIFALIRAGERFEPNRIGHNGRPCGFRTFLHRLVTDRLKDFAKKRNRHVRRIRVSLDSGHAANHQFDCDCRTCRQLAELVSSDRSNPADLAERREQVELLHQAIAGLQPIYRRVAELDAAGLSLDEIAAELKINVGCAKKRRSRARADIRRLLSDGDPASRAGER